MSDKMRPVEIRSELSKVAVEIEMRFRLPESTTTLARATGFLLMKGEVIFLVTNWHNLTGCRIDDQAVISKTGGVPNLVSVRLALLHSEKSAIQWIHHEEPLFREGIACWLEHPANGVDIALLPLNIDKTVANKLWTRFQNSIENDLVLPEPGMDCFIIGFPRSISGGSGFPIWKRASIASEPDADVDNMPKILVDSATREGLSGSPVFIVFNGFLLPNGRIGASANRDVSIGHHQSFLGVYSGRVDGDLLGAQIGFVWKAHCVDEIINAQVVGSHPFPPDLSAFR